ncbi:unnamed protein product [Aureobasidium pullulans]|nr:unnamed protein product [Aureobasidium pullulans]
MPSIQDSINSIKDQISDHDYARQSHEQTQREHERILDEYDRMTRHRSTRMREEKDTHREHRSERRRSRSPPSMRFRFKDGKTSSGSSDRRKSKHRPHRHRHRSRHTDEDEPSIKQYTAHPSSRPREATFLDPSLSASPQPEPNTAHDHVDPDSAFRESLFDAMADDEGAAYWEGVYGDSIHSYPRPSVEDDQGHLEKMTDDQYVEYVKAKMWEKKNPELLRERQAREEREQEAQDGRSRKRRHDSEDEYEEDFEWSDVDAALARGAKRKEAKKWQQAWSSYQQRWQHLKANTAQLEGEDLLKAIPWPVQSLSSQDVSKQNVEDFFSNAPLDSEEIRTKTLKDESVNWHPDRFQRRFGGSNVDEETLKLATSPIPSTKRTMCRARDTTYTVCGCNKRSTDICAKVRREGAAHASNHMQWCSNWQDNSIIVKEVSNKRCHAHEKKALEEAAERGEEAVAMQED